MNSEGGLLLPAGTISSFRVCLLNELGLLDIFWAHDNYRRDKTAGDMGVRKY